MKRKRILIIIIEFVLLLTVMGGIYYYTQSEIAPTKVFIFNSNMATGEIITKDKLAVVELPASAINANFLREQEKIIGNVVSTDVTEGQYVLTDLVTEENNVDKLKTMDKTKLRLISFPVEMDTSLSGDIEKGDVIDLVYLSTSSNIQTGEDFTYSKIFLSNIVVWSVNTEDGYEYSSKTDANNADEGVTAPAGTETISMTESDGKLASITVAVTGPQAEQIAARAMSGKLQILGRFPEGEDVESTGYTVNQYSDVYAGNVDPEKGVVKPVK